MRNRRREYYEDKRLDWRDPNMPCWTLCQGVTIRFEDGRSEYHDMMMLPLTPEQRQEASKQMLVASKDPDWRNDPTYYAAKRKRTLR